MIQAIKKYTVALVALLCASPIFADNEAKIEETNVEYATLAAAVAAATNGQTVTLLKDVALEAPSTGELYDAAININNAITLDGGSHTISLTGSGWAKTGNGKWDNDYGMFHAINVLSNNVTITDLTVNAAKPTGSQAAARSAIHVYIRTGFTLNNVTVKNGGMYGIIVNGSSGTINDVKADYTNNWGVNIDNTKGETDVLVTGTQTNIVRLVAEGTANATNSDINLYSGTISILETKNVAINITKLSSMTIPLDGPYMWKNNKIVAAEASVTTGQGSSAVTTKYETFKQAVAAANTTTGATVTLLANVTLGSGTAESLTTTQIMTLDINGKTLDIADNGTLNLNSNVTIVDNATTKGGIINDGKINVGTASTLDFSALGFGSTGLIAGKAGSMTMTATSAVKMSTDILTYYGTTALNLLNYGNSKFIIAEVGSAAFIGADRFICTAKRTISTECDTWNTSNVAAVTISSLTTEYPTLQQAIDAVPTNGTAAIVRLLTDVTENVTIASGKVITLDLNDKTLTEEISATASPVINNNGTLTVTGNGTIQDATGGKSTAIICTTGTLAIENGYLIKNNSYGSECYIVEANDEATVSITNGKFKGYSQNKMFYKEENATFTITGGLYNYEITQYMPDDYECVETSDPAWWIVQKSNNIPASIIMYNGTEQKVLTSTPTKTLKEVWDSERETYPNATSVVTETKYAKWAKKCVNILYPDKFGQYHCDSLSLTDPTDENYNKENTSFYTPILYFVAAKVTYTRQLNDGWNSMVLPFPFTPSDYNTDYASNYIFSKVIVNPVINDEEVKFTEISLNKQILPGTPIIVRSPGAEFKYVGEDVEIRSFVNNANGMAGTYLITEDYAGKYSVNNSASNLAKLTNKLYPFRSCVNIVSASKADFLSFTFDDATSINNVKTENNASDMIYNAAGMKVNAITKSGLYIINGKKVFVNK